MYYYLGTRKAAYEFVFSIGAGVFNPEAIDFF